MVYAYLTPDFRKHISRELWYIFFVWSFSVMMSVRPSVKFLQSATALTVTTQLIDVKLYNVLEIHCSCPQWILDFLKIISFPILGGSAPGAPPWILLWFRSCGLQNHPPTPSTRPSMKNLKSIVDNYNVFQVHYIV
jgi:hypothetical protein